MRVVSAIMAAIFLLVGFIWVLQGIGVLPGSFMTGQLFWAGMGLVAIAVGAALLVVGVLRRGGR